MSTVKISQLPNLTLLDSNTANTILVGIDKSTSVTSQFTAKTLAESLYSNTALNVGNNSIILPNVIAQFVGNSSSYLQTNLQNKTSDGSADYVITADTGTDEKNYIDLGLAGSTDTDATYTSILPLDGYLYVQGNTATSTGGNLIIGTTTTGRTVNIIAGGPGSDKLQVKISTDGVNLVAKPLKFADGTTQNTSATASAASGESFANGAFARANASYGVANSGSSFANGAFITANSAAIFANAAFGQANSGASFANGAFGQANSAASFANGAFVAANSGASFANSAFLVANSAASFANGAFITANSAANFANGAFTAANVAPSAANFANASFLVANSAAIFANAAFLQANIATPAFNQANSAASFANGAFGQANSGASFANSSFLVANSAAIFANAGFTKANSANVLAQSAFDKANSAGEFANGAFTSANSGWTKANSAYSLAGTQAGRLDVIEPIAQAAFTNAASALQNTTTVIVQQDLNVPRNLSVNGTLVLTNTAFAATESAITIKATQTVQSPSNDGYMIHVSGKQNVASRIVIDSFSATGNAYGLIAGRTARGTVTAPLAAANGDILLRMSGNGYGTTQFAPLGIARIDIVASENYTDAARGSQIQFWNCAIGSNTLQQIATFNGDNIHFSGVVNPQKGFIYSPRIPAGNQTAITIDYATDSMLKANLAADLTVSHSNFVAGKVVEMWLVNVDNTNHTVTHGCAALRSTNKSTTATITSGSSMHLKFFSIDGDLANTFVSITG